MINLKKLTLQVFFISSNTPVHFIWYPHAQFLYLVPKYQWFIAVTVILGSFLTITVTVKHYWYPKYIPQSHVWFYLPLLFHTPPRIWHPISINNILRAVYFCYLRGSMSQNDKRTLLQDTFPRMPKC